jgi:hypothetical protein
MPALNRRHFLQLATAAAATTRLHAQPPATARLNIGHSAVAAMPSDFTGLSYESPQLANPKFFSPDNHELIAVYRELSPNGVLRTGGNLSAFTFWRDAPAPVTPAEQAAMNKGKHYWEWDLTDPTIRNGNHEAIFTPASIEALSGFLKATGWRLIYGLNFATGTPEQAAAEAACVQRLCGNSLIAFQLGNEIDFWGGGFRPKPWDFDDFYSQWKQWVATVRKTVPNAPFGGPDTAVNLNWVEQLADAEGKKISLLSKHHYAMGPAGDPKMNAAHLLGPDPDVAKEIEAAQRAKAAAGVGFRTTECGSCFHGGQPGVSNAYASALWAADYMLTLAQGGHAGINMHGGGEGRYSAITGDSSSGFTRQPLYFGMKFAQQFAGSNILGTSLNAGSVNMTAYAAQAPSGVLVALINKDAVAVKTSISGKGLGQAKLTEVWKLSAPSLDSRTGVTFATIDPTEVLSTEKNGDALSVAPYTAILAHYR